MRWDEIEAIAKQNNITILTAYRFTRQSVDPGDLHQHLKVKTAARILGITPPTLYKMIRNELICAHKVKGVIVVHVHSLRQELEIKYNKLLPYQFEKENHV